MPAVVAYDQRRRHGQDLVEPRDDLAIGNFLWMTFGDEPVDEVVEAFNVLMILYENTPSTRPPSPPGS